jgi:adenosine deaminase
VIIDRDTLHSLPKTDLHCHLDGSLRPETVREFLEEDNSQVPDDLEAELEVSEDIDDLNEYLEAFELPTKVLQSASRLKRAAYELAVDAHKENVWYLEVRFAPFLHTENNLDVEAVVKSVLRGLRQARRELGIQFGVILTSLRQGDPSDTK